MNISTNHHYIPKFYIKGFTNSKGFLHIYDKLKDELYENRNWNDNYYIFNTAEIKYHITVKCIYLPALT